MNTKAQGAVSGAMSGAKAAGPLGAFAGALLGAAKGGVGTAIIGQRGRGGNGTLRTPAEQMETPNERLWSDSVGGDMFATTPDELVNVAQGINNGYGEI